MKKHYTILPAVVLFCHLSFNTSAQQNYWSVRSDKSGIVVDNAVTRQTFPQEFRLFELNLDLLSQELFAITDNPAKHSTLIYLPNANGTIEQFEIFEASNFEPNLQAQFPQIRAFSGKGITDKYATLKLSISPQGVQSMVFRTDKENEFIEPYSQDHTVYAVFESERKKGNLPWVCSTNDQQLVDDIHSQIPHTNASLYASGELKTLRLVQSCNGEYANYFGATSAAQVGLVLAAYNATLTRCNGVYERDLALHLNLIANTTAVIYYDPATDPYTTLSEWNGQLQATLTAIIGEANYDIGHMFGASGGGGNAGCIGCVCDDGVKGRGITSPADGIPMGDNFDIDYVAHEVGHQLGGNHTFSHFLEGTGVNKEVGSGITIMGYAGITSQDVAPHSIEIFHEASIDQIKTNLATKSCPVTTGISANNATPVIAPTSNYTIPIGTPFALTGSATDSNGDPLTYCWEQNDNSTTSGLNSVASPTKVTGPNWLSFNPTASPTRTCPILPTILAGLQVTPTLPGGDAIANIEALSSVSRTLNFRLTVRDNHPYSSAAPVAVGQTAFTDMTVVVTNSSGPFQITAPNSSISWEGLTSQTISWDVNNTTDAPVSCSQVKISLSTDGGLTFPAVLSIATPNDGSEMITVPDLVSNTVRIKIEAIGNIFFDISDANLTITKATCISPTITCAGNLMTNSTPGLCSAVVNYATSSTGTPPPVVTYEFTGATTGSGSGNGSGSTFNLGVTTVTLMATNDCGNPDCSFFVTVLDDEPPSIICLPNLVVSNTPGECGTVVSYSVPVGTDNCPGATTQQTAGLPSGAFFPVGITTNTFMVIDVAGNVNSCSFTVKVEDTTDPVITCPDGTATSFTLNADANCQAALPNYISDATATDNCTLSPTISQSPVPGSILNGHGTTQLVTLTADDGNGNTTECSFIVVLEDITDPLITCPDGTATSFTLYVDTDCGVALPDYTQDAAATDNCTLSPTISQSPVPGSILIGHGSTQLVTLKADDGNGNTSECSFTVTLEDTALTLLNCPEDQFKLVPCGENNVSVTLPFPSFPNKCQVPSLEFRSRKVNPSNVPIGPFTTYSPSSGNTKSFGIGRYEIEWRATVYAGQSYCSHYLQVSEIMPTVPAIFGPSTICPNLTNIPYSVSPQPGITSYQWSYSGSGAMIHNNGTPDITMDFSPGATSGILTVEIINPCGGTNASGNINIQLGGIITCSFINCLVSNLLVTDNTFLLPGTPHIFKVSDKITSNATITVPKTVLFKAGNSVDLSPGFHVNQGAVFVAEIEDCPIVFPFRAKE